MEINWIFTENFSFTATRVKIMFSSSKFVRINERNVTIKIKEDDVLLFPSKQVTNQNNEARQSTHAQENRMNQIFKTW